MMDIMMKVFIDNENKIDSILGHPQNTILFNALKTKTGSILAHCNFKPIENLKKVIIYDNYFIGIACNNRAFRKRTYLVDKVDKSSKEGIFILTCSISVDINNNTRHNELFIKYANESNISELDSLVNPIKIRDKKLSKI